MTAAQAPLAPEARPAIPKEPCVTAGSNGSTAAAESVLGSLLIGGEWSSVSRFVRLEDYPLHHRLILAAIASLGSNGEPHDPVTVAQQLERMGHLEAVGGLATLSALARNTATPANVAAYARAVREGALKQKLPEEFRNDIEPLRGILTELDLLASPAVALRHVADIVDERREVQWLADLYEVLERNVLAVLAGSRSTFKSFVALHWMMLAAVAGESGVILSAEGGGLGLRVEAWMRTYAPAVDLRSLKLLALERAMNLNAPGVLEELRRAIDAAGWSPALILTDTLSKYAPGLKENSTEEMTAFLSALGRELRDHYRATVLLVAHSGHADPKRPRGSSTLMCNPDAEYIVERADATAMTATVSRERFKDAPALSPLAYAAEVVDLDRLDRHGKPVTSLVLRNTAASAVASARKPELRGKAQRQLLAALRANTNGPGIFTLGEMREIGRKAGLHRNTARDAADAIATSPFVVASVGGWRLTDA